MVLFIDHKEMMKTVVATDSLAIEEVLESRRQTTEGRQERRSETTAIAADNPDAIDLLKAKLAQAEATQEGYKAGNKIVRNKKLSQEEKEQALKDAGHSPAILAPDFCGRVGYANYKLANNNANIKRMRDRLADLERQLLKAATVGEEEEAHPELGLKVVRNHIDVRLQLFFESKPPEQIRAVLKTHGFKWAPSVGAWQRQLTGNAEFSLTMFLNSNIHKKENNNDD
jgi:hypothetical protein